ncbi:Hypothetical predicted protein [Olea europaea subsp. europaea]|uniref:Uncharacterized protein n=1 Tax=Olea europaea subsp. europaea TaxID=158383 RepID=A0A8S0UFG2_OLEEU|nr:Hypothetical predicted protein [Olea europaea subsp. europaea]
MDLGFLEVMLQSKYNLKLSVVSALHELALKPSGDGDGDGDGDDDDDLGALRHLLVDRPIIPQEEGRLKLSGENTPKHGCLVYAKHQVRCQYYNGWHNHFLINHYLPPLIIVCYATQVHSTGA